MHDNKIEAYRIFVSKPVNTFREYVGMFGVGSRPPWIKALLI